MMKQPHLGITSDEISPFVLLPGDPARVDLIGKKLDNFKILNNSREYKVGIGEYQGIPVTVCSTGIGCPSTAIAVSELIEAGAKYFIRTGTCGGAWKSSIKPGSLVIATAAVRDEGTTKEYIPAEFPAVADIDVINSLVSSAKDQKVSYFAGINRTHDAFYSAQSSITKWGQYLKDDQFKDYDTPILSSEMEAAALFVLASLKDAKAGAVLAVNADPESLKDRMQGKSQDVITESSSDITKETTNKMISVALEALLKLSK